MREVFASVDLGGTKISAAIAGSDGCILTEGRTPTNSHEGSGGVLARMAGLVGELSARAGVKPAAVGVGVPGLVKAAYCGSRITVFDAGRIIGNNELPEYTAELADCEAGVLAWKRNSLWLVDRSAKVHLSLETDRPIRGAWGHAAGFYALAAELVSFQPSSQAGRRRRS